MDSKNNFSSTCIYFHIELRCNFEHSGNMYVTNEIIKYKILLHFKVGLNLLHRNHLFISFYYLKMICFSVHFHHNISKAS